MNEVREFLKVNEFKKDKKNIYSNNKCSVVIGDRYYIITSAENGSKMYSEKLNIYWLIGVLTYYGYMDKNYKQLN